jgi:hypothetical protein
MCEIVVILEVLHNKFPDRTSLWIALNAATAEQQASAANSQFGVINRLDLRLVSTIEQKQQTQRRKKTTSQTLDFPGDFSALDSGGNFWGGGIPPDPCRTHLVKQMVCTLHSMHIIEVCRPTVADRLSSWIGRVPAILSQYPPEARGKLQFWRRRQGSR